MEKTSVLYELNGSTLTLETGLMAGLATSSILARMGDTMVLATVVEGKKREDLDYFPLTVEYVERLYAGGRIKGSRWVKREGRPSDDAILTARLIDRSIRPLFPKEYKREVQIVVTLLSVDGENEPDILSIIAVSAALSISRIPWEGPISATRVGIVRENGEHKEFLVNPGRAEIDLSDLNLVVSQKKEKTVMLEAEARQVPEKSVIEAIEKAQQINKSIIMHIEELVKKIKQEKEVVSTDSILKEVMTRIEKTHKEDLMFLIEARAKKEAGIEEFDQLVEKIFEEERLADPEREVDKKTVANAVEQVFYKLIRSQTVKQRKRADGRKEDEVRPISISVSLLPRTHGSALFARGSTQSLTVATLGSPRLEQLIESAGGEESKRYIHHYSMPPYSVGETGRMGVPTRREIGHGALAERALLGVIPSQDKFPYTIRVVSEILSSNGSTSMAAACGSTLALMDAGVPIEKPVAGIAMGMMSENDNYVILTDIIGLEDFAGDMDFKIAGTDIGITAMQLDVKTEGLTISQIQEVLDKGRLARLLILEQMQAVIPQSRSEVSEFAPKIEVVQVPPEKIGEIIGPGGKVIRQIIAETGATVDVEDDGSVTVSAISEEAVEKATNWVRSLTHEVRVGEIFEGKVKRILPFGAFVEIIPGKEGMVHVSQMASSFVRNPQDVVEIGQVVKVRVLEIDEQGRINLSMLFGESEKNRPRQDARERNHGQEHPLSLQFKRERQATMRSRNTSRFRKPR